MADVAMRAWRVHEYGEPLDVLRLETVDIPEPEAGEVRVRVEAIPLNLNDLERITGGAMMVRPELPYSPGMEVLGVVESAGEGAETFVGRRVAAITRTAIGGYAEAAVCPAAGAFGIPDDIALPDAAALLFPFHLAWLGLFDRAGLTAGETVLVHAAAGGSGSAAVQLAVDAGARVIATAGGPEKVRLCRDLGAHVAIDSTDGDFGAVVMAETDGRGADVVFDNVGEAVFERSLGCLAYNGRYVMMGFASNKAVADEPFVIPRRLMLATRPSDLETRLRQSKPISQGNLWRVSFEALLYQGGRIQKVQQDPEAMLAFQRESMVYAFGTPLVQGRNLHFQGRYEMVEEEPGARSLYLEVRVPDAEIDIIKRSKYVREKVGLQQQLPEDEAQQAQALEGITQTVRERKRQPCRDCPGCALHRRSPRCISRPIRSTSCQTRSRLPLQIFATSASPKPRRRSPSVTLRLCDASIQPVTAPPPSKSEAMPTWSMPAIFAMCSTWSRKSSSVASGCSASMRRMPST